MVAGGGPETENHKIMRRSAAVFLAAIVAAAVVTPSARAQVPTEWLETGGRVFAGGGTFVSNGVFFPGTLACSGSDCSGLPPIQLERGTDLEFVNLDPSVVTNGHQIVSYKRKRGEPVFSSDQVDGPAVARVITSHLKPGVYRFFCATHFGMEAALEIVP